MTAEAVDTLQTQKQREDEFFAIIIDDDDVLQTRRIPRSKIRQIIMNEYGEQLFEKEIRRLHIRRE